MTFNPASMSRWLVLGEDRLASVHMTRLASALGIEGHM